MFGSRRKSRKHYTPPTAATVNPSAATAAVSAYNLSSAAAAAALRALPAAPTDVSAVQTKRTKRRSASLSSEGSRRPLSPVPSLRRAVGFGGSKDMDQRNARVVSPLGVKTLRRRGSASSMRSVSSMSERTFRSPSPHQSRGYANSSLPGSGVAGSRNTPYNAAAAAAALAAGIGKPNSRSQSMPPPPVPTIPEHVVDNHPLRAPDQSSTKLKKSRRVTSLGLAQQPLKLASEQQHARAGDRSSWFGPAAVGNIADIRTSDLPMDINGYARPMSPVERPESRSSLHNFSYPSRQRLSSPPASPTHSRNTSLTESVGLAGATAAATAAAPVRNTPSVLRSVSTERAPTQSSKAAGFAAVHRSASTSRVPGHSHTSSLSDQSLVYDANSRRMVPRAQLMIVEESSLEAPARPRQLHQQQVQQQQHHQQQQKPRTARKKKQQSAQQQPQPQAQQKQKSIPAAAVSSEPSEQEDQNVAPVVESQTVLEEPEMQAPIVDKVDEVIQPVPALSASVSTPSSSVTSLPALAQAQTASPAIQYQTSPTDTTGHGSSFASEDTRPSLMKRPSVVHEDPEREEEEGRDIYSPAAAECEKPRSRSPQRTAHFSPIVSNNLSVQPHSPPSRSVSPRKSALKHTSSPRDTSPSDTASEAAPVPFQPLANAESIRRKKANRVSFDEKATVLTGPPITPIQPISSTLTLPGAAGAPPSSHTAHQPPTRSRSWFASMGRNKNKTASDVGVDNDDAVMKPRPALPSFGSVRDKAISTSQQEERALVKPSDSQSSRPLATSSSPPHSALKSTPLETLDASSDHAIGPIISAPEGQAASAVTRNTANTSRFREPLPPVVTSVDGSGYVSDSGASLTSGDDDDDDLASTITGDIPVGGEEHLPVPCPDEKQDATVPVPVTSTSAATEFAQKNLSSDNLLSDAPPSSPKKTVPAISVSHPSQENLTAVRGTDNDEDEDEDDEDGGALTGASAAARTSPVLDVPDIAGGTHKPMPAEPDTSNTAVPIRQEVFDPITQEDDLAYSSQMPATVIATHMPPLHEEPSLGDDKFDDSDSDSEVFSDAYEDLSDIEGDGFLSLDAVVDSPIMPNFPKNPFGSSALAGSSSCKNDSVPRGPSPFPGAASSAEPVTTAAAPTVVAGTSVTMSALMASAASKNAGLGNMDPDDKEDWDKVKAFWRSLSAEKRAQLENEARADAAADGDLEDESCAAKKPRRKKSIETRLAEKRAIQESLPSLTTEEAASPPIEHKTEAAAATRVRRSMRDMPAVQAGSVEGKESGMPSLMAPTLRQRDSDSSESSFKRTRGVSNGIRKSLRGPEARMTSADTDAITLANTAANEHPSARASRFSLRSLSPAGSTTLRGSADSSPQFKRTLRDGSGGGFAASEAKRMSSPGPMASATLRKGAGSEASSGFFSSLGKKSGGKLLQRGKNPGGGSRSRSRSRFEDSSDDDDDVFGPGAGLGNSAPRHVGSVGGYTFRSRFVDSSDEDEAAPANRTPVRPQGKDHVVPKSLRGNASNGDMMNSSRRPGSSSAPKGFLQSGPRTAAEDDAAPKSADQTMASPPQHVGKPLGKSYPPLALGSSNIGTTTLRRARLGRGQPMDMSPGFLPTTTGMADGGLGGADDSTPTRHRRASSLMSVLRRKKRDNSGSSTASLGVIGHGAQKPAALRSSSTGSSQRQRSLNRTLRSGNGNGNGNGSTPRIMTLGGEDSDEDASEVGPGVNGAGNVGNVGNVNSSWPLRGSGPAANHVAFSIDSGSNQGGVSLQPKKKKFPALRRVFRLDD